MKRILSCKIRKAGIFMLAAMLLCTTSCIYDEIMRHCIREMEKPIYASRLASRMGTP